MAPGEMEPKKILARHLTGRTTEVNIKPGESLHGDPTAYRRVHKVEPGQTSKTIEGRELALPWGMVVKEFLTEKEAEHVQKMYRLCKEAGLPVATTYRIDVNQRLALMTNFNVGGRIAVSSNNKRAETPVEHGFVGFLTDFSGFIDRLFVCAKKAAQRRIFLNDDAYLFCIDKDPTKKQRIDFVVNDFEYVGGMSRETEPSAIAQENVNNAEWAVSQLIRKYCIKTAPVAGYLALIGEKAKESKKTL